MKDYQQIWQKKKGYFSLNIVTTRGCPYKCNWCAKPIYGNRYNSRSPQKVADEILFLMQNYGVSHFWVCDDIFGLTPHWLKEFRTHLEERKIRPRFKIQSRADLLLKENTIDDLVAVGLDEVWIGAESGSQTILDAMDKGITVEEIEKSTLLLKEKGVKVAFFLQYGYLGETLKEINLTLQMIEKLKPDAIGISVSYPLPKTVFYEKVKHQLQNKYNWVDSDDLDTMYKANYSPQFYKHLQKFTHKKFRKNRALSIIVNQKKGFFMALLKLFPLWIDEKISAWKFAKLQIHETNSAL
jgi:anaerobic magnesium-protoporphyrin IX monomethyl ester cyclase